MTETWIPGRSGIDRTLRGARAAIVLMLAAACWLPGGSDAQAQVVVPGIKAKDETKPKPAAPETPEQEIERLTRLIGEVRAAKERFEHSSRQASSLPPGVTSVELEQLRSATSSLEFLYESQIKLLGEIVGANERKRKAADEAESWRGFNQTPPYPVSLLDQLEEGREAVRRTVESLDASVALSQREQLDRRERLSTVQTRLRRLRDDLAHTPPGEALEKLRWQVELAQWDERSVASEVRLFQLNERKARALQEVEKAKLALLQRQLEVVRQSYVFTEAELKRQSAVARRQVDAFRARFRTAQLSVAQRGKDHDAAKRRVDRLRAAPATPETQLRAAELQLEAAERWLDAAKREVELLSATIRLGEGSSAAITTRHALLNAKDADSRREARRQLALLGERIESWVAFAQNQTDIKRAALREREQLFERESIAPELKRYADDVLEAMRYDLSFSEESYEQVVYWNRVLRRWLAGTQPETGSGRAKARLADIWADVRGLVRDGLDFELFTVDETTVVDGRAVTVSRGVTVGKSLAALIVFLVALWVAARIARRVERMLVARFGFDAPKATMLRRWLVIALALVMLVMVLHWARIPLTVFAFLGGALAIGIGFGTQTIIKNFISGLIVLMERQVRVGDTVEVDGTTGKVTEVNIRSSTVRGFDGVEAIVPNSTLLETKVINWTHSDNRLRRIVRVGVAYGSPVRKVSDLLQDVADRHGLVLKDPAPYVLFEDFGDSALVFALYFWIEMSPEVNSMRVMSDLRFMIEAALSEAGVVIAFPQRDVHLDTVRPLQVEIMDRGGASRA